MMIRFVAVVVVVYDNVFVVSIVNLLRFLLFIGIIDHRFQNPVPNKITH